MSLWVKFDDGRIVNMDNIVQITDGHEAIHLWPVTPVEMGRVIKIPDTEENRRRIRVVLLGSDEDLVSALARGVT